MTQTFNIKRFTLSLSQVALLRGMDMADVALATGVAQATLSRMRNHGLVPNGGNLAALCKWAGLDVAEFVDGVDDGGQEAVLSDEDVVRLALFTVGIHDEVAIKDMIDGDAALLHRNDIISLWRGAMSFAQTKGKRYV